MLGFSLRRRWGTLADEHSACGVPAVRGECEMIMLVPTGGPGKRCLLTTGAGGSLQFHGLWREFGMCFDLLVCKLDNGKRCKWPSGHGLFVTPGDLGMACL